MAFKDTFVLKYIFLDINVKTRIFFSTLTKNSKVHTVSKIIFNHLNFMYLYNVVFVNTICDGAFNQIIYKSMNGAGEKLVSFSVLIDDHLNISISVFRNSPSRGSRNGVKS